MESKDRTRVGYIARLESFAAAHRLHSPLLSDSENLALYGKCNHVSGHGHNYRVTVTVQGPIDPRTGMITNLTTLKELIWERALVHLDHRHLDKDVEFFSRYPSTAENVAVYVWQALVDQFKSPIRLFEVQIQETDSNSAIYRGEYQ
eukprot:TRINITY_DN875_c0_g1_i1.p1 TRINITY_DN875_c0_g1~~TRINITY_DN875_c0_g1_i1.p1  ORF type:complete len:147 (-),score=12.54 TRINITY_DN875_c0_g1_i1:113-553(-)